MLSLKARAEAELELRRREAEARKADDDVMRVACRDDPARFSDEFLGGELWSKQIDVCNAVAEHPITIVPAGRAVGKSFLLARLVLWFIYTREDALVITTGPDHRQVVTVLWAELKRALKPRYHNGVKVSPRRDLPYAFLSEGNGSPQRLIKDEGSKWGAIGFACKSDEGLSGQHAPNLMMICDEASGIADPIWEAIFGAAASRYVIVGNPIKFSCRFRELFDEALQGGKDMAHVTISSLEHPHAALEHSPVGAVSASWLRQMGRLQGVGSPWWNSNVKGCFPGQESVRFYPLAWLDKGADPSLATDENWQEYPPGRNRMAIDIGAGVGADKSVVLIRNDKQLLEIFASEWHGVIDDSRHRLEPEVTRLARKWGIVGSDIVYDKAGIGRSFGSYLAREPYNIDGAIGYFGAGRGGHLYINRRTANAFAAKRRFDPEREGFVPFGVSGVPEWPSLRNELATLQGPTMEMEEGQVRQLIETKESISARLGHSSDYLDAFLMSFTYSN